VTAERWVLLLVAATALHAGFQLVVTAVAYPALVRVPPPGWAEAHGRHSRAITPVVALVYGCAVLTAAGAVWTAPGAGTGVAAAATLVAVAVTATRAAPTHGRLAAGPQPQLLRDLLVADRVRCAAALVSLAGALSAALG
jgi:hypothetical protein